MKHLLKEAEGAGAVRFLDVHVEQQEATSAGAVFSILLTTGARDGVLRSLQNTEPCVPCSRSAAPWLVPSPSPALRPVRGAGPLVKKTLNVAVPRHNGGRIHRPWC